MKIIDYLRRRKSATVAKNRLQIIIAQQRGEDSIPDYLPVLRREILEVISKYTNADLDAVKVDFQCGDQRSILELNVQLPGAVITASKEHESI